MLYTGRPLSNKQISPRACGQGHMTSFFYPRDASQLLAVVVCLTVHPSVCLSQVGVLLKRLNTGSRKQRHAIAPETIVF